MTTTRLVLAVGGLAALAGTITGMATDAERALAAYLVAVLYWLSLALGGLVLLAVGHATRARWFVVVRRLTERIVVALPILALLFLPVLFGVEALYPWSHGEGGGGHELPRHLASYLNIPFFVGRALFYFVAWITVGELLYRWSRRQDRGDGIALHRRQLRLGAGSLPLLALTLTFASFDWLMSLEPRWVSTAFGVYVFAGAFVATLALLIVLAARAQRGPLAGKVLGTHFYALGRLLLAFVVFWAYIAYAQFFLIWIADLPEEVTWYAARLGPHWRAASWVLAAGHFLLPFLLLLSKGLKYRPRALAAISVWLLAMHYVDLYWLVMPALYHEGTELRSVDPAAFLLVGLIVLGVSGWRTRQAPALPAGDPELRASLRYSAS